MGFFPYVFIENFNNCKSIYSNVFYSVHVSYVSKVYFWIIAAAFDIFAFFIRPSEKLLSEILKERVNKYIPNVLFDVIFGRAIPLPISDLSYH